MNKTKKELRRQTRIHLKSIRKLVLAWNPLGIPGIPEDEYSSIEMWLYRKLLDGVSIDEFELEKCLFDWQAGFFQLNPPTPAQKAYLRHHAEAIMAWWEQQQK